MAGHVSALTIAFMAVTCIVSFAIPAALFIYLRKRKNADILPFFIGFAVFFLFALVLESIAHNLILPSPTGEKIQGSIWLYGLYGGFMAGLFEETGRFVAFKTVLRRYRANDADALMYGAGHGGFEAAMLVGVSMISNMVFAALMNAGQADKLFSIIPAEASGQLEAALTTLSTTPPLHFLLGSVERITAIALHMSLSVLVWFAAKEKNRLWLYPLAILFHLLADMAVVVLSEYIESLAAVEGILIVITAVIALFAVFAQKCCARKDDTETVQTR